MKNECTLVPCEAETPVKMGCLMLFSFLIGFCGLVACHGRLRDPPSRSSAWRDGFPTTVNYNDNELFCGGFAVQYEQNGGKCGICGDAWQLAEPRPNELGGEFGQGITTRTYKKGQEVDLWVELTQNHIGYFEFRVCPLSNAGKGGPDATQDCLDKIVLENADGSGTKIPVFKDKNDYKLKLKLPKDLTCDHCVFQWHYWTGNRWDVCPDGTGALGCGPQEVFRGCADIKITN